jgi:hypothetical protein
MVASALGLTTINVVSVFPQAPGNV